MISRLRAGVWRHRDLRALAAGQTLSWLGDGFQPIALAVGIVVSGGTAGDLGVPMAALMVGRVVFTLLGGVWGDRLQPVHVMACSDFVRMLLAASLVYVFATDSWNVLVLALIMGLSGASAAFFHPAFTALKPRLVPDGEQQQSNAALAMLETSSRVAGPLLAGLMVAALGPAVGFAINGVGYAASATLVLRVQARPERTAPATFGRDLRDGLGAVLGRPWLASGILAATLYHVANGVVMVLLPIIVVRDLGGSAALGGVEAAMAVGALVGGLIASRLRPRRPMVLAYPLLSVTALGWLGLARPEALAVLAMTMSIGFGALMVFGVFWETTIQRQIPGHQLARVGAWDQMASFAGFPLGSLLAGSLISTFGAGTVVVGCVLLMLTASVLPLLVRDTWRVRAEMPRSNRSSANDQMITMRG